MTASPRLLVEVVLGAVAARLRRRKSVDDTYLEAVIDLVLRGAEHGGAIVNQPKG